MSALWTGEALALAVGGRFGGAVPEAVPGAMTGAVPGAVTGAVTGISIDTRTLVAGELFVALVSESGDGHAHVAAALQKGAAAALVHASDALPDALRGDARLLHVQDTFTALQALGRAGRARFRGRLVAVTGSVGKTTTKEMLRTALSAIGPTHAAVASLNNHWGVPLTLARLPEGAAFCVSEIGMNHPGEIAPLAALARPDVAIVTTVAATHIGHMGSLEAIALEKGALFGALVAGGTAVFPADAPHVERLSESAQAAGARIVRFGDGGGGDAARFGEGGDGGAARFGEGGDGGAARIGRFDDGGAAWMARSGEDGAARRDGPVLAAEGGTAWLDGLVLAAEGSDATAVIGGRRFALRLAAPGRHMAMNALACLAAVDALGADVQAAADALAGFVPGDGRGALRPLLDGAASLLDESYNASGASMRAALSVLKILPAKRRIAVLGDMLELGSFAQEEHETLNQSVRESADVVYCSGVMMKFLFDSLPESMRGGYAADARSLAPAVVGAVRAGDVVLVKGSYGSRMRDVVAALTAPRAADAA